MSFTLVKRNVAYVTVKKNHFKALKGISQTFAIADHAVKTGHNIKWDHFQALGNGSSDLLCKIKETLLIRDLKPALNENVGIEKLWLYYTVRFHCYLFILLFLSYSPKYQSS